jgi:microcystin-dependent protein
MASRNYVNTTQPTSLTGAADDNDTSLTVASTAGFPTVPFTIGIERGDPANEEVCLVTAVPNGTTFTVTRGYDGTDAVAHDAGVAVEHCVIALDYRDANAHIYDTGRDDHTQYLNEARYNALDHEAAVGDLAVPIGGYVFTSVTGESGRYLRPDGRAISRTTYADYFALVGTTYGVGDGSTTFNIPDVRNRFLLPMDNLGTALGARTGSGITDMGETGGLATVTLTTNQMPQHTHVQNSHTHVANSHTHDGSTDTYQHRHSGSNGWDFVSPDATPKIAAASLGGEWGEMQYTAYDNHDHTLNIDGTVVVINTTVATNQNSGGGQAHENMPPYIAVNVLLRVQ